jgi:DNA modification methylase
VSVRILVGDARAVLATLPAESVHMVCTSPPYWGLRDYGLPPTVWGGEDPGCAHAWGEPLPGRNGNPNTGLAGTGTGAPETRIPGLAARGAGTETSGAFCVHCNAWRGALGLEPDPGLYVAHLVEVFRAVRRVLREDATCWINLGDSYANVSGGAVSAPDTTKNLASPRLRDMARFTASGLKPKDLIGLPWRVAFALQADGWWLRSEIIWAKPNPMPESVTDRPTKAHEQLFLLAKAERYFFDAEAIKESASMDSGFTKQRLNGTANWSKATQSDTGRASFRHVTGNEGEGRLWQDTGARNRRSVWTIPSAPFSEAHFATFPPALVEPCVQAGTSACGACPACGAPWRRETSIHYTDAHRGMVGNQRKVITDGRVMHSGREEDQRLDKQVTTLGWAPTCACAPQPVPCVVLDPFAGAGTVGLVADRLGRDAILIELKPEYAAMAERRIREEAPLLTAVAVEAAAPPASDNGHGLAAPEQLGLDWPEIARVDV